MLDRIKHDDILELRLARPPVNALNLELLTALREAIETAPDTGARALILSGRPGVFTAGLDLPWLIAQGIEPGEQVATSGSFKLRDAALVAVAAPVAATAGVAVSKPADSGS